MMKNGIDILCSSLSGLWAGGLAGLLPGNRLRLRATAPRAAAGVRPVGPSRLLLALVLALLPAQGMGAVTGDKIVSRATFTSLQHPAMTSAVTVTVVERTASAAEFLKYAPGIAGSVAQPVTPVSYLGSDGSASAMALPVAIGTQEPIDLSAPLPLLPSRTFHQGEPVFVRITDPDQNLDRELENMVLVTVSVPATGDAETLRLTETGPDTGVFVGYIQTTRSAGVAKNGILTVGEASDIKALYVDVVDGSDSSAAAALVDPFGVVFDSITGKPVDGAQVELMDAVTGLPAAVLGDNGAPGNTYPSAVVSGGTATDAEGRVYSFNPGGYRFPFVPPGNYRLRVTPPQSHTAPSTVPTSRLQALPGAPFAIVEPGSRGEAFEVASGPAIRIDLPIDPKLGTLWLGKSAGKPTVSAGEHLGYEVTLQNTDPVGTVFSILAVDKLPPGFRYRNGSARLNGAAMRDPVISADGSTLTFAAGDLGPKSSSLISYVASVGAGARPGTAVNVVTAATTPTVASNEASAAVTVQEAFLTSRNIIMGRVFVGACGDNPEDIKKGMEGIGIYLEDGTFVVSDRRGMFHFEGVASGSHVVQLDLDSIPEGYRVQQCEKNSRFAGRAYSQFAELQGGTMWRTDFFLGRSDVTGKGAPPESAALPEGPTTAAEGGELQTNTSLSLDAPNAKGMSAPEVGNALSPMQEGTRRLALPPIVLRPQFPTFSAELNEEDRRELNELALLLGRFAIDRIEVTGHTDRIRIAPRSRNIYADNTALSFARAKSVGRYLAQALHLPPEGLYLGGKGEREPVDSNRTDAGRARNRRVEVKVYLSQQVENTPVTLMKDGSGVRSRRTGSGAGPEIGPAPSEQPHQAAVLLPASTAEGSPRLLLPAAVEGAAVERGAAPRVEARAEAGTQAAVKVPAVLQAQAPQSGEIPAKAPARPKDPPPPQEEQVELLSALSDGVVHHRVRLVGVRGPVSRATVTLTMPKSFLYMNKTSRLSGIETADPETSDAAAVYRLDKLPQDKLDLRLQSLLDPEIQDPSTESSVTVVVSDAEGKPVKTFSASAELSDNMEELEKQDLPGVATPQAGEAKEEANSSDFEEKVAGREGNRPADPNSGLQVKEKEGIVSPTGGAVLASQVNSVQLVLNSALTPVLTLDGQEIPYDKIGFKMKDRESDKSLYTYLGVDFGAPGERRLQLKGVDGFGLARFEQSFKVTRTGDITAIRVVADQGNVADGRTPVRVRVQLLDQEGQVVPANAELSLTGGELRPYREQGTVAAGVAGGMVAVDARGWIKFQPVTTSGLYRAQLAYNKATVDIETYVKPKMRDWILVGLAEGTAGYNTASGHMQNLKESGADDKLYQEERLAFYAKGSVKGEWLLTISYDSDKQTTGVSGNALFQNIDPNAFYTLYGDATVQGHDASSQKKLFLKVERDQFNAILGDYDTGLSVTELSRYSRRLNGVKTEYRSREYEVTAFGSETGQSFVKDELRGDGTSGLYRLSRRGLVANSEQITLQSRDRFQSEKVTDSRPLTRFIDYSIDYEAGTLFFKAPVPSRDEKLDPVYIVVDYEVADAGADAFTYGGRAARKFMNGDLKLAGNYIHEGHLSGSGNLYGADAALNLAPGTRVRAEIATSEDTAGLEEKRGAAYLAEVTHAGRGVEAKAYVREQQQGFGLGQQMGSEAGTRKLGAEGSLRLNNELALNGQAYRQYNLVGDGVRDLLDAQASYGGKEITTRGGLRYANDSLSDGRDQSSVLGTAGVSWKTLKQRLVLKADHEQALFKKNNSADFPTRTILGADFQATRSVLLFAQEELTSGDAARTSTTRVGMKATPWSGGTVSSSVANDMRENEERTFANVGLAQRWQLNSFWAVDGGFDHSRTIRRKAGYQFDASVPPASGGEDFSAVSLGANYQEKKLLWSNRVEYRDGETEKKWGLVTGVANELGLYWGWTGKLHYLRSRSVNGIGNTDADLRLGVAYRPPVTRWILLDRLDLATNSATGIASSTRGRRIVNNLNANYRPDQRFQLSLQYGAKYVLERFDDLEYGGYTDLVGIEGRYDLTETLDLGLRGSLLHSWQSRQLNYSLGPSVGCNVMQNAWLSLGYNLLGFRDRDFSAANYTSQGPFLQFRVKFDQNTVKEGLAVLNQ